MATKKVTFKASAFDATLTRYPSRIAMGAVPSADRSFFSSAGTNLWFSTDAAGNTLPSYKHAGQVSGSDFWIDAPLGSASDASDTILYAHDTGKPVGYDALDLIYDGDTKLVMPLAFDFDDQSGNANNGTGNGWITEGGVTGPDGVSPATDFDGSDDYLAMPQDMIQGIASACTWKAWIKKTASGINQIICYDRVGAERQFQFRVDADGGLRLIRFDSSSNVVCNFATSQKLDNDEWYLVAATFSVANGSRLYIDGTLRGTDANQTATSDRVGQGSVGVRITSNFGLGELFGGSQHSASISAVEEDAAWIKADYLLQGPNASTHLLIDDVAAPASNARRRRLIIDSYARCA
jgi:hypothetical protein